MALSVGVSHADPVETIVTEAARMANIPPVWITAVMRVESGGDMGAVSGKGAMGLMQLMPETWAELRAELNLGADPFDPHDNIVAGAAYLRLMHDRYGDAGFLAAYNAGPARYDELLATGRSLPDETRNYVARVARWLRDGGKPVPSFHVAFAAPALDWRGGKLFAGHENAPGSVAKPAGFFAENHSVSVRFFSPVSAFPASVSRPGFFVPASGSAVAGMGHGKPGEDRKT
jgi:hypothetical protein